MVFKSSANLSQGFTFVELIVTIAIIAILTIVSFPYYNSVRNNLALERAATKLVQDIRRAQELAISGQEFSGTGSFPTGGYGIYFAKNSTDYSIFADADSDKQCRNNCSPAPSSERVEVVSFENNIKIIKLDTNDVKVHAIFVPPNPDVFFTDQNGNPLANVEVVVIRIGLISDSSQYRDIKINKAGLVWVE